MALGCRSSSLILSPIINLFLILSKSLDMSSKPPLGVRLGALCAAKVGVEGWIEAKVVFTWHGASTSSVKLTVSGFTVGMQNECIVYILPERRRQIRAYVAPDVDVFHSLARAPPHEVDDVKVFEVSSEVVSEIDAMSRIAACCSPVGGVSLQRPHSLQT